MIQSETGKVGCNLVNKNISWDDLVCHEQIISHYNLNIIERCVFLDFSMSS